MFERGKLAMNIDGEFRTAFIDRPSTPTLDYSRRRCRCRRLAPDLYGAGYVTGNIARHSHERRSRNHEAAWQLVKWLSPTSQPR